VDNKLDRRLLSSFTPRLVISAIPGSPALIRPLNIATPAAALVMQDAKPCILALAQQLRQAIGTPWKEEGGALGGGVFSGRDSMILAHQRRTLFCAKGSHSVPIIDDTGRISAWFYLIYLFSPLVFDGFRHDGTHIQSITCLWGCESLPTPEAACGDSDGTSGCPASMGLLATSALNKKHDTDLGRPTEVLRLESRPCSTCHTSLSVLRSSSMQYPVTTW